MQTPAKHITRKISSSIDIKAPPAIVWENITNVNIDGFSDPRLFRLLGIPRPLKAELVSEGQGGRRIAYFDTGKRFIQEITVWQPFREYSFKFNPEKGFIVGHFFDLSDGVFQVPEGAYHLSGGDGKVSLQLSTSYRLDRRVAPFFNLPVRWILKAFQRYLLKSIKKNSE